MTLSIVLTFFSKLWNFLALIAFTPLYIEILGIEAYGVISISIVFLGMMSILDAGLTPLAIREMALPNLDFSEKRMRINNYEFIYFVIVLFVLAFFFLVNQLQVSKYEFVDKKYIILLAYSSIFIFDVLFQIIIRFYIGCLQGLERHYSANVFYLLFGIFRSAFVVFLLSWAASLEVFFYWQAFVSCFFFLLFRVVLFYPYLMGQFFRFTVKKTELRRIVSSAKILVFIALFSAIIGQLDKMVFLVSDSLSNAGGYNLASSIAATISSLSLIFLSIFLPKFVILLRNGDTKMLQDFFIMSFNIVAIFSITLATHLQIFSYDIMRIFLPEQGGSFCPDDYLPILAVGHLFISLTIVPYGLALASGYLSIQLKLLVLITVLSVFVYPLMSYIFPNFYIPFSFMVLQIVFSTSYVFIVTRKLLPELPLKKVFSMVIFIAFLSIVLSRVSSVLEFETGLGFDNYIFVAHFLMSFCVSLAVTIIVSSVLYYKIFQKNVFTEFAFFSRRFEPIDE
jgi:O-antigen/teichoic acid export membrane protein